ncbi:PP2C family protein-serine/threonine phosphatase [Thiomicrospira sp.]|uniref:PP2C family protein-serine/threonine phosphatase n=1 Tax=Thiomicrospira sp. TaxID=935 RepID=UPI002F925B07
MYYFYGKSQKGKNKSNNDDFFCVNSAVEQLQSHKSQTIKRDFVFALADGVGGVYAGGKAAEYLTREISKKSKGLSHALLLNIIERVHAYLKKEYCLAAQTVFTAALCKNGKISLYHVGDCRAYKITKTDIVQLTNDHTFVQDLINSGLIGEEMKNSHPKKNLIKQALGGDNEISVDVYHNLLEPGERLILTSDGVHDYLSEQEILDVFKSSNNIQKNIEQLIRVAFENGSKDDITAVGVRCV